MIGSDQSTNFFPMFTLNMRDRSGTDCSNASSSTNDFCDEIDEIMNHEQDDVGSLENSLPGTPLDLDLDSITDLLDNPTHSISLATSNLIQPLNIHDLSPTFSQKSHSNSTTSNYSSLETSPKFTNINPFPQLIQGPPLHRPTYFRQQENSEITHSFELPIQSDVKRFRSASMNDGPSLQYSSTKFDPRFFDPNRSTYVTPSNPSWSFAECPRPTSNSFSEVENQQQQLRLNPQLTTPSSVTYRHSTRFGNFPQQTLYSINQSTNENLTPPSKKRLSLADFPVEEVKDDPSSPSCTVEQSEPDLWSDIEQNSSDLIPEDDNESNHSGDPTRGFERSSSPPRFWKYNVQSKGPKTKRILYLKERDPHLYREFSDPVYQIKLTQTNGQNLNKLRKGDGNDVTPNPTKLYQLGKQIRDLLKNTSSLYQGIYNVEHHSTANDTMEAKKEKNKLASKTCRLRKKAQHEANKLKLQGLNDEHKCLIDIIASMKLIILKRYQDGQLDQRSTSFEGTLDQLITKKYGQSVAGNADGFVEAIVNKIESVYSQKSA